jgi:RNA polymerase sigma-70 factor (ECF subfamily)
MDGTAQFEAQRPRLRALATRMLSDPSEAEDVVQQTWLRLHRTTTQIDDLSAWLTTVTARLCLDALRARRARPHDRLADLDDQLGRDGHAPDPADAVLSGDAVAGAMHLVLERLSPAERVAFVLHDVFAVEFDTVAVVLDTMPVAARKLASRARSKVRPQERSPGRAPWEVVDAFLAAARGGDLDQLLTLLAPEAVVVGDAAAVLAGTPERIAGRDEVAAFFDGAAAAALPVFVDDRPGAAWFDRGVARVAFDFTVDRGRVQRIGFRAEPSALSTIARRRGSEPHPVTSGAPGSSSA